MKVRYVPENVICYIALKDEIPVGILRYNLFWDNTPFCNLLFIAEPYRRTGIGKELMRFWEEDMHSRGYDLNSVRRGCAAFLQKARI